MWENRLAGFAGEFTRLRSRFDSELTLHTAVGVHKIGENMDIVQMQQKKIIELLGKFGRMDSPDEKAMDKFIVDKGGRDKVLGSEELLKEVSKHELSRGNNDANGKPYTFEDLQDDLKADIDQLLEKNLERFSRKIKAQNERIAEKVTNEVIKSGERVLSRLERGPHERLRDHVSDIYINLSYY
jgi:hypothetical protein